MKYRLILFDVDSTLIKQEVIDLLAEKSGHGREVQQITARAMKGEIDFAQALSKRVSLLEGLPESVFDEVIDQISFAEGFDELFSYLRKNGFLVGAVSGGFHNVLDKLFAQLQLDFLKANVLEVVDGRLTGKITSAPIDRMAKARALREFAALHNIELENTVAVGDGANDLDMIEIAGLGVSYMGKEILRQKADLHLEKAGLNALIQYLN
ncbi:MAG: phosphoserine phosphatase SerB [Candidatus Nanopelagicaceae bacterium]